MYPRLGEMTREVPVAALGETLDGRGGAALAASTLAALSAGMAPRDAYEGFLVEQMAAAHEGALACFGRAAALGRGAASGEGDRARAVELRLGARLATLFQRHGGAVDRHRAALYRERAALRRERAAARKEAAAEQTAEQAGKAAQQAPRGGVVVEPLTEPMEVIARRFAAEVKANKRWHAAYVAACEGGADDARARAAADAAAPARRPAAPPGPPNRGPGCLVVPEKPSPEEWTRGVKAYKAALLEEDP